MGSIDNNGAVFWRFVYLFPGFLLLLMTLVDLVTVRTLNSPLYLTKAYGPGKALEALVDVYGAEAGAKIRATAHEHAFQIGASSMFLLVYVWAARSESRAAN